MSKETRSTLRCILTFVTNKNGFFFWFFIRLLSAVLPLYTIYLFGQSVKLLEDHALPSELILNITLILFVRLIDNYTRLLSIHKLEYLINQTEFAVHQILLAGLKSKTKHERHQNIQAVRNLSEAVRTALYVIRQPGLDSLVSFIMTPIILYFLDFKVFIFVNVYILVYHFIDIFTTERYSRLKDIQNAYTEKYFAKLQDTNDVRTELSAYSKNYLKLCNWGFWEWTLLQNTAVIFHVAILFYLIYSVSLGQKQISDLILIMGYVGNTQIFLNNLSTIKDTLTDTNVALLRLAKNRHISAINLSDLV